MGKLEVRNLEVRVLPRHQAGRREQHLLGLLGCRLALLLQLLHLGLDHSAVGGVGRGEVGDRSLLDELLRAREVARDVVREPLLLRLREHAAEELPALGKVVLAAGLVARHVSACGLLVPRGGGCGRGAAEGVGEVVGRVGLVAVHAHGAVPLVVAHAGGEGAVHGDGLVVRAEAVPVRVGVAEQARLQHLVGRGLDAGHQVRGREGQLLHLGEVVCGVAVQPAAAHLDQRELRVRPDLGHVEGVEGAGLGLVVGHGLDVQGPAGELSRADGVEQVADGVVRVAGGDAVGLGGGQVLHALVCLEVPLHVVRHAGVVHHLECVAAIPVHLPEPIGGASVGEEEGHLVRGLGSQADKVPHCVWVFAVGGRVALLRVDERGEQHGVPDEEDGRVVAHHVPVALLRVELERKPSRVSGGVRAPALSADSREARSQRRLLAHTVEQLRLAVLFDLARRHLEVAKGAPALGMHHALRNALSVESSKVVDEGEVLQHY
mmetsp:Transcript_2170/g.5160  ORF Transcript_2170/g.5160 Transcript_2170/m.5160 type:complete len:491 (+) Transcript_2170:2452-3924(+)